MYVMSMKNPKHGEAGFGIGVRGVHGWIHAVSSRKINSRTLVNTDPKFFQPTSLFSNLVLFQLLEILSIPKILHLAWLWPLIRLLLPLGDL